MIKNAMITSFLILAFTSNAYADNQRFSLEAVASFYAYCFATNADYAQIKKLIKPMKFKKLPDEYAQSMSGNTSTNPELYLINQIDKDRVMFLGFDQPNVCSINIQGVDFLPVKKAMIEQFKLVHIHTNDIGIQNNELYVPGGMSGEKNELATLGAVTLIYAKPSTGYLSGTIGYLPPETAKKIFKTESQETTSSTKGLHFEIIKDGKMSRIDNDDWSNFVSGDELVIKYKEKIKKISTSTGRITGVNRNSIKDKKGNEYFFIQYSNGGNSGNFGFLVSSYNNELIISKNVHNLFLSHDEQSSYYYFRDMFPKRSTDETEAISFRNNFIEDDLLVELSSELTDICDNNWCGACKTHIPSIIQGVYYDGETIHLNKLNLNEMLQTKNGRNAVLKLIEHIYSRIADNTNMGKINIEKYLLSFDYNEKNLCRAIFDKKNTEEIVQLLNLLRKNN